METVLNVGIIFILVRIAYLDFKYYYIADADVISGILLSLCLKFLQGNVIDGVLGMVLGLICSGLVYIMAKFIYEKTALGSGDVTLFSLLGSIVGAKAFGSWAVFFSICFLCGLTILCLVKRLNWRKAFPLAPFLNSATLLWLLLEHSCWHFRI